MNQVKLLTEDGRENLVEYTVLPNGLIFTISDIELDSEAMYMIERCLGLNTRYGFRKIKVKDFAGGLHRTEWFYLESCDVDWE
jgi:hypothetical protein